MPATRSRLGKSPVIIGREAKDCDIVIPNQAVSRVHAQITELNGQYSIEDLKSRNHTYVNNKLIEAKVQLRDNDRIKICDSLFSFHANPESLPPLPPEYRREDPSDEEIDLPRPCRRRCRRCRKHAPGNAAGGAAARCWKSAATSCCGHRADGAARPDH